MKLHNFSINNSNNLIYVNSLGVIFNQEIALHHYNKRVPIRLEKIRKSIIIKKRVVHINYVSIFLVVSFFFLHYTTHKLLSFYQNVFFIIVNLILLMVSIFYKKYSYKLILFLKETDLIEIKLHDYNKNDAKVLMSKINKKIKEMDKLQQVS